MASDVLHFLCMAAVLHGPKPEGDAFGTTGDWSLLIDFSGWQMIGDETLFHLALSSSICNSRAERV